MRRRGRLSLALVTAAVVVGGGAALDRTEPASRSGTASSLASSGAWFCPHGGGRDWQTQLFVANPGPRPVRIRVTSLSTERAERPSDLTVPPRSEVRIEAGSGNEAASSYVEYFGGWVAAGWVANAGGQQSGVAAEPCAPEPGTRWFAADGSTEQGQEAALVIMNPFDVDAVVDIAVLSQRRAPIRASSLTNLRIAAHRSRLVRLNTVSVDELAAAAEVVAHAGRVAVASLGVDRDGGVRSALAAGALSPLVILPGTRDVGQSTLAVMVPGVDEASFGATLLSEDRPEAAGGLSGTTQGGQSARAYPFITQGPSVVELRVAPGSPPLAGVRRSEGQNGDPGATGGAPAPAASWILLPTVAGDPNAPGLVLGNPGSSPVEVALTLLGPGGVGRQTEVTVPPVSAIGAPPAFVESDPSAAVLAVARGGSIVVAGASSSLGKEGVASYAVAAGVPIPDGVELGS